MAKSWLGRLLGGLRTVVRGPRTPARTTRAPRSVRHAALPDFEGRLTLTYAPRRDREADPGEVVWTWVPFEDDPSQGKDRPVLVVGRDADYLLGLMLTTKDHSRNAEREARAGRHYLDIGSGDWDAQHRPSEIRLDRVLRIDPADVRREGAIMPRSTFDEIVGSLAEVRGW